MITKLICRKIIKNCHCEFASIKLERCACFFETSHVLLTMLCLQDWLSTTDDVRHSCHEWMQLIVVAPTRMCKLIVYGTLRGAWRDRDTNDIFAHCSLISYFLDFKFSNFICLSELHPLIWFFFKNSFRKKKSIRKTTQNALAPSIFIVLSIVLKLGTPLLHTQAQNTLIQNSQFRFRSWDMNEKPPKTLFYPTRSALMKHNFFRRSKLKNL